MIEIGTFELPAAGQIAVLLPLCVAGAVLATRSGHRFTPVLHAASLAASVLVVAALFHAIGSMDGLSGLTHGAFYLMAGPVLLALRSANSLLHILPTQEGRGTASAGSRASQTASSTS